MLSLISPLHMACPNHRHRNLFSRGLGNSAIGDILLLHVCIFQLSTLFSLAGRPIPVEGKSLACLIGMEYRIIILIIMISLGQIFYHILQTHHACAYTYVRTACTHSRIHVRAHRLHAFTHTRTHTPPAHSRMCARTPPAHARIQACAHAHVQTHTQSLSPSAAQAIAIRCLLTVTVCSACDDADRWLF